MYKILFTNYAPVWSNIGQVRHYHSPLRMGFTEYQPQVVMVFIHPKTWVNTHHLPNMDPVHIIPINSLPYSFKSKPSPLSDIHQQQPGI